MFHMRHGFLRLREPATDRTCTLTWVARPQSSRARVYTGTISLGPEWGGHSARRWSAPGWPGSALPLVSPHLLPPACPVHPLIHSSNTVVYTGPLLTAALMCLWL